MAVNNGLYVLVNIHWDGGWLESNIHEDSKDRTNAKQKAYWEQIATKLRDFDEHVMFASANEPRSDTAAQATILGSYHQTFVNAVRSTGGRNAYRVLVVQGLATDINLTMNFWEGMPADTVPGRQMMEVHYYPGYFSNKGEDDANGLMHCYWGDGYHSLTDTTRNANNFWRLEEEAFTDAQFAKMKTKFVDQGIPVLLGEYAAMLRWPQTCADYDLHLASREHFWKYVTKSAVANGLLPFGWETGGLEGYLIDRATPAVHDKQVVDAMIVGAGKAIGTSNRPGSWNVNENATDSSSTAYMRLTINRAQAAASYNFSTPVNWSGKTLKVVLNFDQAFVSNRNGGMADLLQFYTYSAGWTPAQWNCLTSNKVLVAGEDTEFTCSGFGVQNAVGMGILFSGTAGSVTIKRALIK
jgi:endoglucanase